MWDLPGSGIEPMSSALAGSFFTAEPPGKPGGSIYGALTVYFPGGSEVKVSAWNAGYLGLIPEFGRSPGEGIGNPLQYSCLGNPMEGGAWYPTMGLQRVRHD